MRGVGMSGPVSERNVRRGVDATTSSRSWTPPGSSVPHSSRTGTAAQMAVMAAATHPERVDSLVARSTATRDSPAPTTTRPGLPEHMHEPYLDAHRGAVGNRCPRASVSAVGRRTGPASSSGGRGSSASVRRRVSRAAQLETILALDVRDVLPLVEVPTLVDPQPRQRLRPRRSRPLPRRAHSRCALPRA